MLNEVLKYLGIDPEKAKDLDTFKTEFTGAYYNKKTFDDQKSPEFRELFPKMIGKFAGKSTSKLQSKLKSLGVELKDDDIKDKDFEDVLDIGITKLHGELDGKIKTLTDDSAKNVDQRVKDLETENQKYKTKVDDLSGLLKTTKETLAKNDETFVAEKKNWNLNSKRGELFKSISYNEKAIKEPLLQKGFLSDIDELYKFDDDEKDGFIVLDKKTSKRIPNKAKNGEFLTPEEAVKQYGIEKGVIELNPQGGKQIQSTKVKTGGQGGFQVQKNNSIFEQPQEGGSGRMRKVSGMISEE